MLGATLGMNWYIEGKSAADIGSSMKSQLGSAVQTGLMFWPVANTLVYKIVPPLSRPIVSSAFGGIWGIYLAGKAHSNSIKDQSNSRVTDSNRH